MKEPHKRRCAVVGADFKSFVRPGTGRSKRHLRRPLDRVHHVLAGRVSRTNFNLLVVAAIPQVDAHAHQGKRIGLALRADEVEIISQTGRLASCMRGRC